MGRRIPKSKRHKKLKFVDPNYAGPPPVSKRNRKIQPNEPPTAGRGDYQEVPRYVEEFIDLKNKAKQNKLKKRKKKKKVLKDDFIVVKNNIIDNVEPGVGKPFKKLPEVLKQKKYENENQFFNRLQKMANTALAEAKMEEKYNIELVNVDKKGNAEYVTAPKEITENQKEKRKKLKDRLVEKKRLKKADKEFDLKKEYVKFGEVVNGPPVLTAKPRKAPELKKAGNRQLALKTLLPSSSQTSDRKVTPLSTKWKTMPLDKRKIMESERLRAVQMYRLLKNKKASMYL